MRFDPHSVRLFRFVGYGYDEASGVASFEYALDDARFVETFTFPAPRRTLNQEEHRALDICLRHLFLLAGISYYKAAIPPKIVIDDFCISEATAHFLNETYFHGLGEFAYMNNLDLEGRIKFPFSRSATIAPSSIALERRTAVPVGGGKDSAVCLDMLMAAGEPITLMSLGAIAPAQAVSRAAELPLTVIQRKLSPALLRLNDAGALNGHIPFSALLALLLPISGLLHGYDAAALANEWSASFGNVRHGAREVNHQYSKSHDFEKKVATHIREHLLTDFDYFSLLRPLSELSITRLFSKLTQYHPVFTSCNRTLRMTGPAMRTRWCLDCPKCRSTFLLLAPFLSKAEMVTAFGGNLLDDETQAAGYAALLGLEGNKPFDCVGVQEEYLWAFRHVAELPEWESDAVVQRLGKTLPTVSATEDRALLTPFDEHSLPPRYEAMLHAYL